MVFPSTSISYADLISLFRTTQNPGTVILDRLGLLHKNYTLRLKNGTSLILRPKSGDRFTAYEVFIRRVYSKVPGVIVPGAVVLDVGANIGCFSVYASSIVGPMGKIIAIEPVPHVFKQLLANLFLNTIANVIPIQGAIAAKDGEAEIYIGSSDLFSSFHRNIDNQVAAGASIKARTFCLSGLLADHSIDRIDLLKIDCEGAEYDIFYNMTLDELAHIRCIVAEFHTIPDHRPKELVTYLTLHGFRHHFDENHYFLRD